MFKNLTPAEYEVLLRHDFATFAMRCFHDLNPQTRLAMNWHLEVIAAKLTACREGKIRRLIINLPPRHLKSLLASIAFPAWCLGHDSSAQFLSVRYAQHLADKLARDCRAIMMSPWYRQIFPTRLAPHRHAVQEFITTRHGYRLAPSPGGVLTGRGADIIVIDDPLKPEEALSEAQRQAANEWYDHTLYSRLNGQAVRRHRHGHPKVARGRSRRPRPRAGAVGGRALSGNRRNRRGAPDRDDLGSAMLHAPSGRALAPRPRAARHPRPYAADDRRIQLRRPVSAIPRPAGRRPGQGRMVQALSRERAAGALRPYRAKLGYRQQGDRAQRLLGVHNLGSERQGPLPPRCVPPAARVPGAQARRAGAAEPVRCERGADRGQGLGHPADPGADRRRVPWRPPLPADPRKDHAS